MEHTLDGIAKALQALDRREVKAWLQRGELLTHAQALCAKDGAFTAWLSRNKIAKRTAYKAIAAHRDFASVPTSARFTKEAMDVLSQSPEARAEAIELSKRQRITGRIARQILHRHLAYNAKPLSKKAAKEGRRKISGEGFTVTIDFPAPPTIADLMGALAHATKVLRDEMAMGHDIEEPSLVSSLFTRPRRAG